MQNLAGLLGIFVIGHVGLVQTLLHHRSVEVGAGDQRVAVLKQHPHEILLDESLKRGLDLRPPPSEAAVIRASLPLDGLHDDSDALEVPGPEGGVLGCFHRRGRRREGDGKSRKAENEAA